MDTWGGSNHNPITWHKYLYANANPSNVIDPSGHMSLGSLGASISIVGTLTTIANVGITGLGMAFASEDSDSYPDAVIVTLGGSVGSGGAMAEAGGDAIFDLRSGKAWQAEFSMWPVDDKDPSANATHGAVRGSVCRLP